MEKTAGLALKLTPKVFFTFGKYWLIIMGYAPPFIKQILLHIIVVLHYIHHIWMACLMKGGGGEAVKKLKNKLRCQLIKSLIITNFV